MNKRQPTRRNFIKNSVTSAAGLLALTTLPTKTAQAHESGVTTRRKMMSQAKPRLRFSVIGINHDHIHGQIGATIRGGGEFVSFYAKEPDLAATFAKRYPQVKQAQSQAEILEDPSIQLVLSAAIPVERAPLGIAVMQHGKDYMSDKPGITTLAQLAEVRRVQRATKRIYSIMYSERFENKATVRAGELIKAGAIGKVLQTAGLGPHRMNVKTRPQWFFNRKYFGGIICDIASHQFDQFLFFTESTRASIVASQVGNIHHPQYPAFEDFGDVMLRGDGGMGYIRVDWFTPDGLSTWGDGRLTIIGTDGFIEIRKNVDVAGRSGGNHLFLTDQKETRYMDCNNDPLPYGEQLVNDVLNRTETAMTQRHCFLATELALLAQQQAQRINLRK
ncbi:MAG TPA: Gfo/Idh/MocA family oxidoreductase [Pyrinomonadaceae bacterium]|jgi:predicted dehydrogenase|nr:Gfo/Idh/MocA family oxidoreductase [Pyrinomonadaceae bacterium]